MVSSGPPPAHRRSRLMTLVAAALAVELLYLFVISAGRLTHWPPMTNYMNDLAEGFRHWHLHLATEPPAALLAKPNPFDPANAGYWLWDASFHGGHYYLYWGPVPALLLAAVKTVFRISAPVGDQHLVFWLTTLQLVAGTLLVERAGRLLFDRPPLVLEVAAILAIGCANPVLYNLARPAVYEAAIVGGQAFLLLGMVFALDAVVVATLRPGRLVAAGAAWGAAFGCRMSVGPTVALLAAVTLLGLVAGKPDRRRRLLSSALWLGTPLALGLGAFLLYNRLRFDGWFDFGQRHQLTWINMGMGSRFIPTNIYAYVRRPPVLSCRFPFAYALQDIGARAFPPGYHLPEGYFVYEPVAGVLPTVPWSWLAPVALVGAVRAIWRTKTFSPRSWAVTATAIAATTALVVDLVLATATNRYLGDVGGAVAFLGALGAFTAHEWLARRRRIAWVVVAAALALAVATALLGLALGVKGQYAHFEADNPPLYGKLVRDLSVCHGPIPPEPK
ncbi:MAG TPA: hypothetical protein VKZ18_25640 [Polyangia bacterium]|nr:hypothetical protein [Polyangia bacterium]